MCFEQKEDGFVVICYPGEDPKQLPCTDLDLDTLQDLIGGYIEPLFLVGFPFHVIGLCDEDGKMKGLKPSVLLNLRHHRKPVQIFGPVVFCALRNDYCYNDFFPLTDEEAKRTIECIKEV